MHCCQTLPTQLVATPLHVAGVLPLERQRLAAAQSLPALAMQLTSVALRCAAAATELSFTSPTNCVQALTPVAMMLQAAAVMHAAAPDCRVTELPHRRDQEQNES